jgi:chemotaxis protein histidine kinase CheA
VELKDRVEQISGIIQELRQVAADGPQAAADGPKTRQLLEALFRNVHSFKAAASAGGFADASRIAHEFENLLHSLRTGKLTLDAHVLRVFDDTAVALLGGSQTSLLNRFSELTARPSTNNTFLPDELAELKDNERHRASEAIQEGANLYVMEALFETTDFDGQFRQLKEQLDKIAEVISTAAKLEEDKINFRIIYAAKSAKIRVHTLFQQAVVAGKALATSLDKHVDFVIRGDEVLLESTLGDSLADALLHLVRNAVDHGSGIVVLEAAIEGEQTQISVTDDGRGINPENVPLLFQPGFTTANAVTEVSGRGVGLDIVATTIKQLGGSVLVTSEPRKGSSFKIMLPNPSSDA